MEAHGRVKDFIVSIDTGALIIEGAAGTGKTHLIGEIVQQLNDLNIDYYLLAPTGRAARNLSDRIGSHSRIAPSTVHSFLYQKAELLDSGSEKSIFELKSLNLDLNSIVIIDEASMLSCHADTDPLLKFGSGNLFEDLITVLDIDNTQRKIIFVGDVYQLPPINENKSVSLDPDRLKSYICKLIVTIILSKIHRQNTDSNVLKSALLLSQQISSENFLQIPIEANQADIESVNLDQAIEKYMWSYQESSIFIAYTQQTVHKINQKFRKLSEYSEDNLEKKERLILMRNSWMNDRKLYNGDLFYVVSIGQEESRQISISSEGQRKLINLTFLDVTLFDPQNNINFSCKILSHQLWNSEKKDTSDELRALIIDFRMRNPQFKSNSEEYLTKIRSDPYFNALHMKFGYAITCHKAQGGEWDEVYIDLQRPQNDLKTLNGFKWLYTAITRARKKINLLNLPIGKSFDPKSPFLFFRETIVNDLITYNFKIISYRDLEYELQLSIERDSIITRVKLYRNARMKITRIMVVTETSMSQEIADLLQKHVNTSLVEESPK